MANYYTKLSFVVKLPSKAAQRYALWLHERLSEFDDERPAWLMRRKDMDKDIKEGIGECVHQACSVDIEKEDTDNAIWISSYQGGVDYLICFLQHLLRKFEPDGLIYFAWAGDCDKPRVDAYCGGAVIITAKKSKFFNTHMWLRKNMPKGLKDVIHL